MTEAEWIADGDPEGMLVWLGEQDREMSKRKLQLLAVACCRRMWDLLPITQCGHVELAERVIEEGEGKLRDHDWNRLADSIQDMKGFRHCSPIAAAATSAIYASFPQLDFRIHRVFNGCAAAMAWHFVLRTRPAVAANRVRLRTLMNHPEPERIDATAQEEYDHAFGTESLTQCLLVAEVFGHLLHNSKLDATLIGWNDRTPLRLAESIYHERAFDRLPILGDALEEAGCTDEAILSHLRSPRPHFRGCWTLDLVLGRG